MYLFHYQWSNNNFISKFLLSLVSAPCRLQANIYFGQVRWNYVVSWSDATIDRFNFIISLRDCCSLISSLFARFSSFCSSPLPSSSYCRTYTLIPLLLFFLLLLTLPSRSCSQFLFSILCVMLNLRALYRGKLRKLWDEKNHRSLAP